MTCYGSKELAAAFRTVRKNTIIIAEEIPEGDYGFQPAPGARTVAETLLHVAVLPRVAKQIHFVDRLKSLENFDFFGVRAAIHAVVEAPHTKDEILSLLRTGGEEFAGLLETASDDFLAEVVTYPKGMEPPSKTRFEMLLAPKEHEMHHRGQLMLVERMLGITPHLTRQMEARIAAMQAAKG